MLCAPSILWPERERYRDTETQRDRDRDRERERWFDRGEGLLGRNFDAILCN